jgi:hypothetical protein
MKRLERIHEAGVIAAFLKNEFYHPDFHYDREQFERLVLNPDLHDDLDNELRRALLFRRRGHMWRELPRDTEWWLVQVEPQDLNKIRVFPRAHWRQIADRSFYLQDIVHRIRNRQYRPSVRGFIAKIQSLSYSLRQRRDSSAVLLIGIDENRPMTILEGNHRLTAAVLASPELFGRQFRVMVGFSKQMEQCCWYETNPRTLWRYIKHRMNHLYVADSEVERLLQLHHWKLTSHPVEARAHSRAEISPDAILDSK